MSRDDIADMNAAHASLFNGQPPRFDGSPWPPAKPYVIAWCPHPRKRCRIGAVYATRWGDLWLRADRRAGPGRTMISTGWYTLLTYPDGSRRDLEHMGPGPAERYGCRHAAPRDPSAPFAADELLNLVAEVRAGKIPRPAHYVAPWDRRAVY